MKKEFGTGKIRYFICFLAFALLLICGYGSIQGRRNMSNRVVDWLPSGFQETKDLYWYLSHFHEGELLMLSWEGCRPTDPALDTIARKLGVPVSEDGLPLFQRVFTTKSILADLMARPIELTKEDAFSRMRGWIISKDYKQGCLVAVISKEGLKNTKAAVDLVYRSAAEVTGLTQEQIFLAGPTLDSVVIDQISLQSQQMILPFFLLISIFLLFMLLRQWLAVFVVFGAAILNEQMSTALVYYTGTHLDTVTLLTASLIFVLTISGSLHLLNYYRDHLETKGVQGAVVSAIKCAVLPCTLACLTTVMGLYSLTSSSIIPIKNFGIFSSAGLIIGTIFFFFFVSSVLEEFPIKKWILPSGNVKLIADSKEFEFHNVVPSKKGKRTATLQRCGLLPAQMIDRLWDWLPRFVLKYRLHIIIISFYALFMCAYYLPQLQTTISFHGMFKKDAPVLRNYDFLENHFGGLVPVEIIISIPKAKNPKINLLEQLNLLDRIDQVIWQAPETDCTLSALNFIPYLPDPNVKGARAVSERSVFNRLMEKQIAPFKNSCLFDDRDLESDKIRSAPDAFRWRISMRVCANKGIVYSTFLSDLQKDLEKALKISARELKINEPELLITGGIPVVHKAQGQLLKDLCSSYLWAFLLILVAVIFFFGGILKGVTAMIPNIYPSIIMFGAMAMMKIPVDMGTMMTASVALGISVDGTIHFLTWFKRGLQEGRTQNESVEYAYRRCGTAMMQAAILCGGGMLVFALSSFVPISRFSWILALLLLIALYGDIVLFPALLYGWVGRLFIPREIKSRIKWKEESLDRTA